MSHGLLIVLTLVTATFQASSTDADVRELTRLESVWNDAHKTADAAPLDQLWADDLEVAVPRMPVMTKARALGFFRSARMTFERYETSDLRVRVYDTYAIVTGCLQRTRSMRGQAMSDDWRFTKVYARRGGEWRVVAFHASDAATP